MKFLKLLTLITLLLNAANAFSSTACHYLVIELINKTKYTWTLTDNNQCSDGTTDCSTSELHSGSWSDLDTIGPNDTVSVTLKDSGSSGPNVNLTYSNEISGNYQQNLTFEVNFSKGHCGGGCGDGSQSINSYVISGENYLKETYSEKSKAPGGITCSGGNRGYSYFTIYYPVAPRITITLPTSNNAILNESILQQTFNNLDPSLLTLFDTYFNNPVVISSNQLAFQEPCTSDGCWERYCKAASSTTGC